MNIFQKLALTATMVLLFAMDMSWAWADGESTLKEKLIEFVRDPFEPRFPNWLVSENVKENVIQRFGKSPSQSYRVVPNSGDAYGKWGITTFVYDGFSLVTGQDEPGTENFTWLRQIEITKSSVPLRYGLGVGIKDTEFFAVFGKTEPGKNNCLRFETDVLIKVVENVGVQTFAVLTVELDNTRTAKRILIEYLGD